MAYHGQKDFAEVMQPRTSRWEAFPGLPGGPDAVIKVLLRGRQEVRVERGCCAASCDDERWAEGCR